MLYLCLHSSSTWALSLHDLSLPGDVSRGCSRCTEFSLFLYASLSCTLALCWHGTAAAREVPYLKGTWRKIIHLPPSAKASRQISPLAHNLSPQQAPQTPASPAKHRPEQHHGNPCSCSLGDRQECQSRKIAVALSITSGQSVFSKQDLDNENKTKGLCFHWARWLSYLEREPFFTWANLDQVPFLFKPCVTKHLM